MNLSHDQISELIEGQKALQKSNEQISMSILRMETLICGNELDEQDTGMIGRVSKLEKFQAKIQRYAWMAVGGFVVVMFIIKYVLH